jgi:hypothetical protein
VVEDCQIADGRLQMAKASGRAGQRIALSDAFSAVSPPKGGTPNFIRALIGIARRLTAAQLLQAFDFPGEEVRYAVLGQINLAEVDAERRRHFAHRPFAQNV